MYYLSDLDYSTREDIVKCLKKDDYKDIVDLKYRMKLTNTEINFILFKEWILYKIKLLFKWN